MVWHEAKGGIVMKKVMSLLLAVLLLTGCAASAEEITDRQVNMDDILSI